MPARFVRRRRTAAIAFLALSGLAVAGCSSSRSDSAAKDTSAAGTAARSAAAGDARTANITITSAKGCASDRLEFPAGAITFKVANKDATAVSEVELQSGERIVGEAENLPPGLTGTFSVNIDAGKYTLYCPGANPEKTSVTVTGATTGSADDTTAALLRTGASQYGQYVTTQVGYLVATVTKFNAALHGTDLIAAQNAYMKARPYYEKIEPVAESFTVGKDNLDQNIDVRVNDVPKGTEWTGFHRIEHGLFTDRSLTGLGPFGDGLLANVKKLQQLTTGLTYKPYELANGAQDLLNEVATSKITGEEEAYSLIDILDFQANDEGAEQAFAALKPGLSKIDPTLTATITARFAALDTLVDTYRTNSNPSGFVLYNKLTADDKRKLAAAVKSVQAPLAQVASKVAKA